MECEPLKRLHVTYPFVLQRTVVFNQQIGLFHISAAGLYFPMLGPQSPAAGQASGQMLGRCACTSGCQTGNALLVPRCIRPQAAHS